ncbi:Ulp1 peptidase [Trifolium repens]|nr:Ulp1 peptidase [Trifolium repens]
MGRAKHEHLWIHVRKVENGRKWICKHCNVKFSGGASRIQTHLGLGGKGGGGIRRCSDYHANEGIHNMASTSVVVNRVYSTQDQGVINQLKQLVIDLECEENDIKKQLQLLESNGKKRKPRVDVWLEGLLEMKERMDDVNNNLKDIHEINKLIKDLKKHKEDRPRTLSTEFVGKKLDFNIKKVMKLVDDEKVFVIGIYGMGGVGKTLLATLVENEIKRKTTFKDVFWITVSHQFSISKLQDDIAKRIGVNLDEDDERIREYYLSSALEKKGKSILILDDVWQYIDLQKVGIHPKVNGIKVIVTSRLEHVCQQMNCQPYAMIQMIPLKCHNDGIGYNEDEFGEDEVDEDWELFMLKLGHDGTTRTLPCEIEKIARCIVERFKGLPLGIEVMARTMNGINDIHRWKHAFDKLNKLEMGQEVEEEVLKIKKDMCLEEIFDEGHTILNKLEAHSLISITHRLVFTHPLVRIMACCILKESQRSAIVKVNDILTEIPHSYGWATDLELVHMRRSTIREISEGMPAYCPNLSTLIINIAPFSYVPERFFKYMNSLTILDLSYNRRLESLPKSITNLRSLVSLILKECYSLKHVPPLGELQALSRLVISNTSIEYAPEGLEKLINLKWLDLSNNKCLNLEFGTFSSYLTKLQYLDLRNTPALIMVEDIQRMKMLECFGGGIVGCNHYDQSMQKYLDMSFGMIKTYHLKIGNACGKIDWDYSIDLKSLNPYYRCIDFNDCDNFSHILPKNHTILKIYENDHWVCLCDALSYSSSSSLRKIQINNCHQLESLFCLSGYCFFCTKILKLEVLELENLEWFTVIHKDVIDIGQYSLSPRGIFSCLKEISIFDCNGIEKLLTPKLVQQLQNLEKITVGECDSVKEIFAVNNSDDDSDSSVIILPKLTHLCLLCLPELKIVCKGIIRCGSFPTLEIYDCPRLERHPAIEIEDVEIPNF